MADANSVSANLATLGATGWVTREDGTYGGSGGAGTGAGFSGSKVITAVGSAGALTVQAGKTVKFTYTAVSGVTRCGIELKNGSTIIGYVNYPDGDNQLFTIPAGVTSLGLNVVVLDNAGSLTLNMASI
jgi:hypothetical protein